MKKYEKIKNSVGISVVNVVNKNDSIDQQQEYLEVLIRNMREYIKAGYKVYLFSFCKYEGDEDTIDVIMKEFKDNIDVIPIKYNGNINEFFNIYGKMENMICGRFHAMIFSCVCRQKMFITSYSDKIDNVVRDLELDLPIVRLEKINKDKEMPIEEFVLPKEEKIIEIIKEARKQDKIFENILTKL